MKLPIRILIGDIPSLAAGETWGDVIDNWEAYAVEWNASNALSVDTTQAPVLDMFGDESISIKSVVKDLNDPKKLFTEYSRSFTVPASKKNNRIFKHNYNIDITNGLDARELLPAVILMNNTTYKVGNVSVESVRMSKGVAVHYKIKFIGKLSELAKKIGQDKITDLNFNEYNIADFDPLDEFDKVATYGTSAEQDLLFPLSSRNDRFLFNTTQPSLGVESARNIAFVNSVSQEDYGIIAQNLVGALKVGRILDKIADTYGFTFTGAFTKGYIQDLYLWLQRTKREEDSEENTQIASNIQWSSGDSDTTLTANNGGNQVAKFIRNNSFIQTVKHDSSIEQFYISVRGSFTGDVTIKLLEDGEEIAETSVSNEATDWHNVGRRSTHIYTVEIVTTGATNVDLDVEFRKKYLPTGYTYSEAEQSFVFGNANEYIVNREIPEIKILDFLSILFKTFNIVAEVNEDFEISTKHYDHYMSEGQVKDVSKYIDVESYNVKRGNVYSSMRMRWSEPKVAMESAYKSTNGREYGSISYELQGDTGVRLTGQQYDLQVESQRAPLEPLTDLASGNLTNVVYTQFSDLGATEQEIKPMLTYVTKQYPLFEQTPPPTVALNNGSVVSGISHYYQPSNTYTIDTLLPQVNNSNLGLYFGSEMNEYNPTVPYGQIGLFNAFYRGTIAMMFDEDKRLVKHTANLPLNIVMDLSLNDVLLINNHYHNINSIETNYLTGESKLDLTLVGKSQLPWFDSSSSAVKNTHSTDDLYITYMTLSGGISSFNIASGGTYTVPYIGNLLSTSHQSFTESKVASTIFSPELLTNGNFLQVGSELVDNGGFGQTGSELVTNGSFGDGANNWSLGSGWSIGAGKVIGSSASGTLAQSGVAVAGKQYEVTINVSDYSSGTLYVDVGGASAQTATGNGLKTFSFTSTSTGSLRFYGGSFTGSIDDVSLIEIGQDWTVSSEFSIINDSAFYYDGTSNGKVAQGLTLNSGYYTVSFDIDGGTGNGANIWIGNTAGANDYVGSSYTDYSNGSHSVGIYVAANETSIAFYANLSGSSFSIDNISLKESGFGWNVTDPNSVNYVQFNGSTARLKFLNTSPITEFKSDFVMTGGKSYRLTVDIAEVASGSINIEGNGISEVFNAVGTTTRIITPIGDSQLNFYRASSNVDVTINSISLREDI